MGVYKSAHVCLCSSNDPRSTPFSLTHIQRESQSITSPILICVCVCVNQKEKERERGRHKMDFLFFKMLNCLIIYYYLVNEWGGKGPMTIFVLFLPLLMKQFICSHTLSLWYSDHVCPIRRPARANRTHISMGAHVRASAPYIFNVSSVCGWVRGWLMLQTWASSQSWSFSPARDHYH